MAHPTATVTAATLNVRRAASSSSDKVGELARGARIDILGRSGAWYEVQAGAVRGFVHGDFVHVDTAPHAHAPGFLCHDDALCDCDLAAPAPARLETAGLGPTTRAAADAWNRFGGMLRPLCTATGIAPSTAVAVLCVESGGRGFLDGRMIIRFENHVFWDKWGAAHPDVFRRHFTFAADKRWTGHKLRPSGAGAWEAGHTGQASEWRAFELARQLDESAALRSISMGAPQIMGYNNARIGYDTPRAMFDRFAADERFHILGLFDFIKGPGATSPLLEALRGRRYEHFATGYNGPGKAAEYGAKIGSVVTAFEKVAPAELRA